MKDRTLNIQGFIFGENNSKFYTIPFSTVKYFNDVEKKHLAYVVYTDLYGRYVLGDNVPVQEYYVTLDAPGFKKREVKVCDLEKCNSDICTLHFKLAKKESTPFIINTYSGKSLRKFGKNIKSALEGLGYFWEGDILINQTYKKVKFIVNGSAEISREALNTIQNLDTKYLILVEEYDLRNSGSDYLYDVVVNVIIPGEKGDLFHVLDWIPKDNYIEHEIAENNCVDLTTV